MDIRQDGLALMLQDTTQNMVIIYMTAQHHKLEDRVLAELLKKSMNFSTVSHMSKDV
jgi:hypothetical protein